MSPCCWRSWGRPASAPRSPPRFGSGKRTWQGSRTHTWPSNLSGGGRDGGAALRCRRARVSELLRAHEGTSEFVDERKLLAPILSGANILYVVDGTRPFRRNYEAEMEILRWTGRPGMALVNRIGEEDPSAEWRRALDQYFRIVRDFDAFSA